MRIFLTGATGYIGSALCRRLTGAGHELRALVRPASRTEELRQLGVSTFVGDLADRASMREGMSGADWVVHAAAELDPQSSSAAMQHANVEGSENVASLAFKLGVPRLLSVSSIAWFGGSPADGSLATEESPPLRPFPTPYSATKHAGQEVIRAWAARGLRLNTVFPSLVYGPPGKRGGANVMLKNLAKGRFPALIGGDRLASWIYLEDLVEGMAAVLERAPPGRDYLLAGDVVTVRQLAERVAGLSGVAAPRRDLSPRVARAALTLAAPVLRLFGRRPPIPPRQVASLERHWAFDDSRARRELGWTPRDLAAGLPPTIEFLLAPHQAEAA
ncbi:MAG TPA: NAD-dependent epimerase/dehydratase family protein [Thermoanaerobaculia bacterium]|nr:NAD-dependent epimerase/dehydratase family protein [Thermoanaerobaculia bacterium]